MSVFDDALIELSGELFIVAAVFEAATDISFDGRNYAMTGSQH